VLLYVYILAYALVNRHKIKYKKIRIIFFGKIMPIRMIAQELYRIIRAVERVEKKLKGATPDKQGALKEELRKLKAERHRMRAILDGKKERKFGV
jgi:hypothetical protein